MKYSIIFVETFLCDWLGAMASVVELRSKISTGSSSNPTNDSYKKTFVENKMNKPSKMAAKMAARDQWDESIASLSSLAQLITTSYLHWVKYLCVNYNLCLYSPPGYGDL